MSNIFTLPDNLADQEKEIVEVLASGEQVTIGRILSAGHCSAPGFWFDQAHDELVVLVQGQAQLTFADGEVCQLQAGDTLFIPAHRQHRVEKTSSDPPCIWIAVQGKLWSRGKTGASMDTK